MSGTVDAAEWVQQLKDLVFIASLAAVAAPSKPPVPTQFVSAAEAGSELPSGPAEGGTRKLATRDLSPEVRQFMRYPAHFQRQMLEYGRRYISANFETENGQNA